MLIALSFFARRGSRHTRARSWPCALLATIACALPLAAGAVEEFYTIDSTQSWVEIDATSEMQLQFFGLVSAVEIPLVSQIGSGGTGAVLPDGSTSDGRRTAIEGRLLIAVSDFGMRRLEIINRRTRIKLVDSGTWLPGLPGDEGSAAPAELAARFESVPFLFDGMAALRGVEFSIGHLGSSQSMSDQGGGVYSFPFGSNPTGGPPLAPFPVDGLWDFETNLIGTPIAGARGRLVSRATNAPFHNVTAGTFVEEPAGGKQVTIPIDSTVFIGEDSFEVAGPLLLRIELRGQIVAATRTFVPEPGAGVSGLAALMTLAALTRRPRKSGSLTKKQWLRRLTASILILGPFVINCPSPLIEQFRTEKVEPGVVCTAGAAGEETTAQFAFIDQFTFSVDGMDACTAPAAGQGMEGNVLIQGEATVQSGFFRLDSQQAKIELSCSTKITGGQPSQPTTCTTRVTQVITHSGSNTGGTVSFSASQLNFGAGASSPVTSSVRVDCGVGSPVDLIVNGGLQAVAIENVDFTCTVFATLNGGTDAEGETVQNLNVVAMPTPGQCETHEDCRQASSASPFCVADVGCTDGSVGSPCLHDSQCDEAQDFYCDDSNNCDDGGEGSQCSFDRECAEGLFCDTDTDLCTPTP